MGCSFLSLWPEIFEGSWGSFPSGWRPLENKADFLLCFRSVPTSSPWTSNTTTQTCNSLDLSILAIACFRISPSPVAKKFWCILPVHLLFHSHITFSVYLFLFKERNSYSPVCYWGQTASWYLHRSPSQHLTTGNMLTSSCTCCHSVW